MGNGTASRESEQVIVELLKEIPQQVQYIIVNEAGASVYSASKLAAEAGDLACERYVLGLGKLQIEVLCNLDKVPAAGAVLFAVWPRIEGATGLPVRVWAVFE